MEEHRPLWWLLLIVNIIALGADLVDLRPGLLRLIPAVTGQLIMIVFAILVLSGRLRSKR